MFCREQPFAEFVPSIVAWENLFITSLVLSNTQIGFVAPVFLSAHEIKERQFLRRFFNRLVFLFSFTLSTFSIEEGGHVEPVFGYFFLFFYRTCFSLFRLGLNKTAMTFDLHKFRPDPALCESASVFFGQLFTPSDDFLTFRTFDFWFFDIFVHFSYTLASGSGIASRLFMLFVTLLAFGQPTTTLTS